MLNSYRNDSMYRYPPPKARERISCDARVACFMKHIAGGRRASTWSYSRLGRRTSDRTRMETRAWPNGLVSRSDRGWRPPGPPSPRDSILPVISDEFGMSTRVACTPRGLHQSDWSFHMKSPDVMTVSPFTEPRETSDALSLTRGAWLAPLKRCLSVLFVYVG